MPAHELGSQPSKQLASNASACLKKCAAAWDLFHFKSRELRPLETHTSHQAALPKDERNDGFPGLRAVKGSCLAHGDQRHVGVHAYQTRPGVPSLRTSIQRRTYRRPQFGCNREMRSAGSIFGEIMSKSRFRTWMTKTSHANEGFRTGWAGQKQPSGLKPTIQSHCALTSQVWSTTSSAGIPFCQEGNRCCRAR